MRIRIPILSSKFFTINFLAAFNSFTIAMLSLIRSKLDFLVF